MLKFFPALLAVVFFGSISFAYEIYEIQKLPCAGGKNLGVVIATQVGFVPEKNPKWYPKIYCDSNALSGVNPHSVSNGDSKLFKKCIDDSSSWVKECYQSEFQSKCMNGRFLVKSCLPKANVPSAPAPSPQVPDPKDAGETSR